MEVPPPAPTAARNGGFTMPLPLPPSSSSQPSRKEWRAVSEPSVRNSGNEVEISSCIVFIFIDFLFANFKFLDKGLYFMMLL